MCIPSFDFDNHYDVIYQFHFQGSLNELSKVTHLVCGRAVFGLSDSSSIYLMSFSWAFSMQGTVLGT